MKLTIIKIGSNVIVDEKGNLRNVLIDQILTEVNKRIYLGEKIVIVTSGAVALGKTFFDKKSVDKRLAAGMGQMRLMSAYYESAMRIGLPVLELLLSRPHLVQRQHFLKLQDTIHSALENKILPIINENDAMVYGSDWAFLDNDTLASSLAVALGADKLLIVSHIDGLYTADPDKDKNAKLVASVADVNSELMKYCSGETLDSVRRGGMVSKLKAARLCSAVGIEMQIVSGLKAGLIAKALEGENVGTTFLSRSLKKTINNRERWILAARTSAASIEVDEGALVALKKGKSLLAVGIKKIYGDFEKGELVEIIDKEKIGMAIGLVDVSSSTLVQANFKLQKGVQVMHADNIMVFA